MSRFARQFAAAASAYDHASPPEPDWDAEGAQQQAIADYADRLVREDEVACLVQELYDASTLILAAVETYRAAHGRTLDYNETTFLARLRGIVKVAELMA